MLLICILLAIIIGAALLCYSLGKKLYQQVVCKIYEYKFNKVLIGYYNKDKTPSNHPEVEDV